MLYYYFYKKYFNTTYIQIKCLNLEMTKWVGYVGLIRLTRLFDKMGCDFEFVTTSSPALSNPLK